MVQANKKVVTSREQLNAIPEEAVERLCNSLLIELGEPQSKNEKHGLEAFQEKDYDLAKRYCLFDPCSTYLAAISCMASACRSPMVADSVLRDAARHTAEVAKLRACKRIAERFETIFSEY